MLQMLRQSIGTVADNLDLPNLAETREKHKQDQLRKQKEGHGEWKAELASDSEEAVGSYSWYMILEETDDAQIRAERDNHNDSSKEGLEELQEKTKEHAQQKHQGWSTRIVSSIRM